MVSQPQSPLVFFPLLFLFALAAYDLTCSPLSKRLELATVDMQSGYIEDLPERRRQIRACVASDVDVFYSLARRTPPQKVDNVKVSEVAAEVVCEIDGMGRIATCCSPVGGVDLQRPHSLQT